MKKKRIKILFIYMLLGMSLFIVLGIGVFNKVKEHNREVAIENNEKKEST
ncbi:hypothetical protein [Fructilactobacillus florum]|nr:hypothetical protein [Fructilactobacillus florum]